MHQDCLHTFGEKDEVDWAPQKRKILRRIYIVKLIHDKKQAFIKTDICHSRKLDIENIKQNHCFFAVIHLAHNWVKVGFYPGTCTIAVGSAQLHFKHCHQWNMTSHKKYLKKIVIAILNCVILREYVKPGNFLTALLVRIFTSRLYNLRV